MWTMCIATVYYIVHLSTTVAMPTRMHFTNNEDAKRFMRYVKGDMNSDLLEKDKEDIKVSFVRIELDKKPFRCTGGI